MKDWKDLSDSEKIIRLRNVITFLLIGWALNAMAIWSMLI